jgi:hypothetical protein
MALKLGTLFARLLQCKLDQLAVIEIELELPQQYLDNRSIASRAKDIVSLLRQRRDKGWIAKLAALLDRVQSSAQDYLGGRLEHLRSFLASGSPDADNLSPDNVGTIKDLREALKEGKRLQKPVLVKVRGTLFPAALLTAGWWERKQQAGPLAIKWKNPLQEWLFRGFDLWAPSWDLCWGAADGKQADRRYFIAQLTEGDEADSLPVILESEKAKRLSEEFRDSWGGIEVVIVGLLGHRQQFEKKLPKNAKRDPLDYYISVEDENKRHKIKRLPASTDLYSGYLWKLVAPEEAVTQGAMLSLDQVYFVWEHTNFVAKEAVAYNLEGLAHKEELIARQHPGSRLVLLQKSHDIVPGKPEWSVEKFYNFYLLQGKDI